MIIPKYQAEYTIRENECGPNYDIRLAALWDIMQDAADHHATILGFSHESMQARGNFWALIRMSAKVHKYPKARETVTVETYPAGLAKLFCVRKYNVYAEEGELLAEASSLWIIVDMKTGRPLRPNNAYPNEIMFSFNYEGVVPEKISPVNDGQQIKKITAEFCDIDGNNHVNNSRYINWLENALRPDNPPILELNTNYILETKLSEPLTVNQSDNIYSFIDDKNAARFLAEITFCEA